MKYWWAIVLLMPYLLFAQAKSAVPAAAPSITVSLPPNVNPEAGYIDYGFRQGGGLSMAGLRMKAGVRDYRIAALSSEFGSPDSLKLLIYIPGYRMVASEFTREDLQAGRIFTPQPVSLATTTLKGRLIDSAGRPMKGEKIKVEYSLTEVMEYFGYIDGMVSTIHVADTTTDDNGDFVLAVPALLDDPFFRDAGTPGEFWLSNGKDVRGRDSTLNPASFPAQKAYEPLAIRKTQNGTLSGKLGKEFFRQNNLSDDLRVYVRPRDTIVSGIQLDACVRGEFGCTSWFNAFLKIDGSFEVQLPAGKYNLDLWVSADDRHITIERDIVIEGNRRRTIERP